MGDCDPGADEGAQGAIVRQEPGLRLIATCQSVGADKGRADVGGSQPLALHAEKRQFVCRIPQPERGAELQAVDDRDWRRERDMLRPQIAVRIDQMTGALPDAFSLLGKEPFQGLSDTDGRAAKLRRGGLFDLGGAPREPDCDLPCASVKVTAARSPIIDLDQDFAAEPR